MTPPPPQLFRAIIHTMQFIYEEACSQMNCQPNEADVGGGVVALTHTLL